MNPIENVSSHHTPARHNSNRYRIVFTRAVTATNHEIESKDLIPNTIRAVPLFEVWVDLSRHTVERIQAPPVHVMYGDVPVPVW